MGSCRNKGPFLGTLDNRCRILLRTQKRDHNFDDHPGKPRDQETFESRDVAVSQPRNSSSATSRHEGKGY